LNDGSIQLTAMDAIIASRDATPRVFVYIPSSVDDSKVKQRDGQGVVGTHIYRIKFWGGLMTTGK
jgi:hypothetical protein